MMHRKPIVYLAGPLFSAAERSYNLYLKHLFSEHAEIYLPQEDGLLVTDLMDSGVSAMQAANIVFKNDINAIHRCDIVCMLLDGRSVDEGAAFELGFAYSLNKICIGLQTDPRRLAPFGNNPMLTGALQLILTKPDEVVTWLKTHSRDKQENKKHNMKRYS